MADAPQEPGPPDVPRTVTTPPAAPLPVAQQPAPLEASPVSATLGTASPPSATHGTGSGGADDPASTDATGTVSDAPSVPSSDPNAAAQGALSATRSATRGVPLPNYNELMELRAQCNELVTQQRRASMQASLRLRLSQNLRPRGPSPQLRVQVSPNVQAPLIASNPPPLQPNSNASSTPTVPNPSPSIYDSPRVPKRTHSPDPASPSKRSCSSAPSSAGMRPAGGLAAAQAQTPTAAVQQTHHTPLSLPSLAPTAAVRQTHHTPLPAPNPASTSCAPLAELNNPAVDCQRPVRPLDNPSPAPPAPASQNPNRRPRRFFSRSLFPNPTRSTSVLRAVNPSSVVPNPTPAGTSDTQQGGTAQAIGPTVESRAGAPVATVDRGATHQQAGSERNRPTQEHRGLVLDARSILTDTPLQVTQPHHRNYVDVRDPVSLQAYRVSVVSLDEGRPVPINLVGNVSASVDNHMPVAASESAPTTPPPPYTRYVNIQEGHVSVEYGPGMGDLFHTRASDDSDSSEDEDESSASSRYARRRWIPRRPSDHAA